MPDLRLVVEVCHARNLVPTDGEGTSSPYVTIEFDGQRLKTKVKSKDLNPTWNEKLEFKVSSKDALTNDCLEVVVCSNNKSSNKMLGKINIPTSEVKKKGTDAAGLIVSYPLEKGSSLLGFFSRPVKGELYLKTYHYDVEEEKKKEAEKAAKVEADKKPPPAEKKADAGGDKAKSNDGDKPKSEGGGSEAKKAETPVPHSHAMAYEPEDPGSFQVKTTKPKLQAQRVAHDLVSPLDYLFVRLVKAKDLKGRKLGKTDPYVEIQVGPTKAKSDTFKDTLNPVWPNNGAVFAFKWTEKATDKVVVNVWDKEGGEKDKDDKVKDDFLGTCNFDVNEIPKRERPDSPFAPQWYNLDKRKPNEDERASGRIMLAVWFGTQADESFPDAWQSDTGGSHLNRAKVYISPRLWYLRVKVLATQDLYPPGSPYIHPSNVFVTVDLPNNPSHMRLATRRNYNFESSEMLFVAAEPFTQKLTFRVAQKVAKDKSDLLACFHLGVSEIPKRQGLKPLDPKWYNMESTKKVGDKKLNSKIHVLASLDGGYHVLDETTYHTSDVMPTDPKLGKPSIGVLELGILSAYNLLPTKTKDGKGTADSYCIAKYGKKWIRTRTVVNNLNPQWHEQYVWPVYDPCTVLTVAVFDNHTVGGADKKPDPPKDAIIGKLRIRLSTLRAGKTYTHSYPLISFERSGVKKKGELEIAVRLSISSQFELMRAYTLPLLPNLHYIDPLSVQQVQMLRRVATNILIMNLERAEPPIRHEVVRYILDADIHVWSYRRTKATWSRFTRVLSAPWKLIAWIRDVTQWKQPITTILVIILYIILVCFPEQIFPTLFLYIFLIGVWHWRYQPTQPPHMDIHLSQAAFTLEEELDEEFDTYPSSKSPEVIKVRYDRLRRLAGRIHSVLSDFVTQLERFHALLSWRDPRATTIFTLSCLIIALILYVVPLRVIGILLGIYIFRPPQFRHKLPSPYMNFFRRLPANSDCII